MAELPGYARYVGYTMKNLPKGTKLPWHRVVNSQGKLSFPRDSRQYQTQKKKLEAEGIVFIDGNLDIDPQTYSKFRGILYVTGLINLHAPSEINGTIIAVSRFTINGGAEWAWVRYDDEAIKDMSELLGTYRSTRVIRRANIID